MGLGYINSHMLVPFRHPCLICYTAAAYKTGLKFGRSPASTPNVAQFFHVLRGKQGGDSFFILSLLILHSLRRTIPFPVVAGTHIGDVCLQLQHLHHFLPHTVVVLSQVPVISDYLGNGNHVMEVGFANLRYNHKL